VTLYLGTQNFIRYVLRAAKKKYRNREGEWKKGYGSLALKKQIARHMEILNESLAVKNRRRYYQKIFFGKNIDIKKVQ